MVFGGLHAGEHLAEQPVLRRRHPARSATRCATRSTSRSSPRRSPAPASASCGGTPRRPQIFMGDTGSLALGGALAGFAILTRTELLLVVLGGLFVVETVSVMLQVGYFKVTKRLTGTGKRIFRMAPIHHHFEMLGWEQVTVVDPLLDHHRPLRGHRPRHLLRRMGGRQLMGTPHLDTLGQHDSWAGVRAVVAGFGARRLRGRRQPAPPRRRRDGPRRGRRATPSAPSAPSCSRSSAPGSGWARAAPPRCPRTSTWS